MVGVYFLQKLVFCKGTFVVLKAVTVQLVRDLQTDAFQLILQETVLTRKKKKLKSLSVHSDHKQHYVEKNVRSCVDPLMMSLYFTSLESCQSDFH